MPILHPGGAVDDLVLDGEANEALTAYKFIEYVDNSGLKVRLPASAGNRCCGVTKTDAALGEVVAKVMTGRAIVELGGTLSALDPVMAGTDGRAIAVTEGGHIQGVILTGGVAGDLAVIWLFGTPYPSALDEVSSFLDGVVAGTLSASKALVVDANKTINELDIDALSLGGTVMDKTAAELNNMVEGVAADYKVARGIEAVTGTATVVTGLATVVAVIASPAEDLDGDTFVGASGDIGDQAGSPAAGSVNLAAWKNNADGDATVVAADAAKNVAWIAIGT